MWSKMSESLDVKSSCPFTCGQTQNTDFVNTKSNKEEKHGCQTKKLDSGTIFSEQNATLIELTLSIDGPYMLKRTLV